MPDDPLATEAHRTTASGPAISVMLIVPDASRAIDWYKRALGARELWDLGGVAGLEIGTAPFFVHEINPNNPYETDPLDAGRTSTRIELFVDDPDDFLGAVGRSGPRSPDRGARRPLYPPPGRLRRSLRPHLVRFGDTSHLLAARQPEGSRGPDRAIARPRGPDRGYSAVATAARKGLPSTAIDCFRSGPTGTSPSIVTRK